MQHVYIFCVNTIPSVSWKLPMQQDRSDRNDNRAVYTVQLQASKLIFKQIIYPHQPATQQNLCIL